MYATRIQNWLNQNGGRTEHDLIINHEKKLFVYFYSPAGLIKVYVPEPLYCGQYVDDLLISRVEIVDNVGVTVPISVDNEITKIELSTVT